VRADLLAVAASAALLASGCSDSPPTATTIIEANIDTLAAQVGGGTQDVELYNDGTTDWTLYSMANRFAVTKVGMSKDTVAEITVPGYIQHITVVKGYGPVDAQKDYALLSMGGKGIAVVDISTPTAPVLLRTMTVDYLTPEYTYSDGGGTVFTEPASTEPHLSGPVNDVLVDDQGTPDSVDDELFIANTAYGIQKTKLSNLIDAAADGSLPVESGVWTLKYAGENPWGGPLSLKLHGGKLYAALGFLGMGVYDPVTLARAGAYNLYADCANRPGLPAGQQEDWFGYPQRKISCPAPTLNAAANLATDGVDADGMPTYQQAAFELKAKNDHTWYPWAEFDRYGKYYYNARSLDLVDVGGKTFAYIAYSLGGLVAVDVSNPASIAYEGYVPAAPAHGPNEPPINVDKKGILSHFGSGMLKEAGVMDVRVVEDTDAGPGKFRAFYTDHFAGLVVVNGAEAPGLQWRHGTFNNDCIPDDAKVCQPQSRVFWPDYEFVKSFDMTPVPVGDESMPAFLVGDAKGNYSAPVQLVTGEINGHGGGLFLLPSRNVAAADQVDLVESSGAGGVSFVDIRNLTGSVAAVTERFTVPVNLVSTNEVGADENGGTTAIAIGHGEGVTVSGNHLYFADGPHGVSVWKIADGLTPIDDLHLVANTLQSEYPTGAVMPTPHAFKVGFGSDPTQAYVMSQSLGMRRLNVSAVTAGTAAVGAPALLDAAGGIYEHNTEAGNVGLITVKGQDHAYGVTFSGKYAIVADGDNGLTVYDTTAAAGSDASVVANIGDSDTTASGKPPVGRAATVKLWTNPANSKTYAVVAAGAYGISVIDMTTFLASGNGADLTMANLIKTFEPLKSDDDNAFGSADGKSVDLHIVGDVAYFSYDSFGLGAYRMADLIAPPTDINPLCIDPTKLSAKQGGPAECRPPLAGYFKLQKLAGYETVEGGALYMTPQLFPANRWISNGSSLYMLDKPRLLFYVAYGDAGVVKIDWSDLAAPSMMAIKGVVGGAAATAIHNGRVYVAAGAGGLSVLK
jgi:hypothetical protein